MRSKPLPSSFGIAELAPSDSPGGLIHTYASMPAAGAARGRSPRPAPAGLHQLPLWMRRSTRDASMRALRSASVDGPVGRAAPPQPLREVSMSMPMFGEKPWRTASLRQAVANVDSSLNWLKSIQRDCRVVLSTTMNGSFSAEVLAGSVMNPHTLSTVLPEAVAAVFIIVTAGAKLVSQPSQP